MTESNYLYDFNKRNTVVIKKKEEIKKLRLAKETNPGTEVVDVEGKSPSTCSDVSY